MKKLTRKWLEARGACQGQVHKWATLYPDGMELTAENIWACHKAGLDVIWVAVVLMNKHQRRKFTEFAFEQRRPHLATLLKKAGLFEEARQIEVLDFQSPDAQADIHKVRDAARDAYKAAIHAGDTGSMAWDAQAEANCLAGSIATARDKNRISGGDAYSAAKGAVGDTVIFDCIHAGNVAKDAQVEAVISILGIAV